jgi:hypothetical protein
MILAKYIDNNLPDIFEKSNGLSVNVVIAVNAIGCKVVIFLHKPLIKRF